MTQAITHDHQTARVTGLPAFNDNYIWILATTNTDDGIVVVDPGDAAPVIDYCRRHRVVPSQIWLTHHHADHAGGIADLVTWFSNEISVFGPAGEEIPGVTYPLQGGERWAFGDITVGVMAIPGHTRGHIGYFLPAQDGFMPPALLSGDVLFGLGCGRLFEGTAAQMYEALSTIAALPAETRVYCAHEYTLLNLPFALAVDGENASLASRATTIRHSRSACEPTVPLTLAEELATNPFLRCDQPALIESAALSDDARPVHVFARLRQMRDTFKVS